MYIIKGRFPDGRIRYYCARTKPRGKPKGKKAADWLRGELRDPFVVKESNLEEASDYPFFFRHDVEGALASLSASQSKAKEHLKVKYEIVELGPEIQPSLFQENPERQ